MEQVKQASLFDQQPEPANHSRKPIIDLVKIQDELRQDTPNTHIKVTKGYSDTTKVSIRETDKLIHIKINPKLIRSSGQLDDVMSTCRTSTTYGI